MSTTLPSHLSMMTGLYPLEHGVLGNFAHSGGRYVPSPKLVLLAEVLQQAGYATAAFVGATPLKRFTGIARGFEVFDEPRGSRRIAGVTNDQVVNWLDQKPERPFFLWVHYYDPHSPYRAPPPFHDTFRREGGLDRYLTERRFYSRPRGQLNLGPSPDLSYVRKMVNTYDAEILYTDHEILRLIEMLRERKLWDQTVVVLVGDHGEGLTQHGVHAHEHVWHEQIHVPFMIRIPGAPPRRIGGLTSVVDLAPTLFGLVKIPEGDALLRQATGRDALADGIEETPILSIRYPLTNTQACTGTVNGEVWQYLEFPASGEAQLFALGPDPFELNNVIDQNPEVAARMSAWLTEVRTRQEANALQFQGTTEPAAPDVAAELRSLGYVDTDEDGPSSDDDKVMDSDDE